jgi:hypothetical protein
VPATAVEYETVTLRVRVNADVPVAVDGEALVADAMPAIGEEDSGHSFDVDCETHDCGLWFWSVTGLSWSCEPTGCSGRRHDVSSDSATGSATAQPPSD